MKKNEGGKKEREKEKGRKEGQEKMRMLILSAVLTGNDSHIQTQKSLQSP